jgi:hypothetical protein
MPIASRPRAAVATFVLFSALLAGCGLVDRGERFEIPDDYGTSDETYTLLYSTLGYDAAASKRVLLRLNDPEQEAAQGLAFQWKLVADGGRVETTGDAVYVGTGWGIPVWEAEFNAVTREGLYRMVVEGPEVALATLPFVIEDFALFRETFVAVALDNAEARAAPIELDNGYFDSNTAHGSAIPHAEFLLGLITAYDRRKSSLNEELRTRTREAIERTFDYLVLLSDPATGQFAHRAATRPFGEPSADDTIAGMRALARYAVLFQREAPQDAELAYRRARLADEWLLANAPADYDERLQAAAAYDFYRFTSDIEQLERAVAAVRAFAPAYDIATMDRYSGDTLPHFETMYRLWQDLPDHPDRALWEETARSVAGQYAEMLDLNAFHVIAPGTTDEAAGTSAIEQWDSAGDEPPPGEGTDSVIGNEWFLARTIDTMYLASIADQPELEQVATASLLWVVGLNPGAPAERVAGASGASPVEAASFLTGLEWRSVHPWSTWEWARPHGHGTIVSGFRGDFVYDDEPQAGDTSIGRDGLWLQASTIYEDMLAARSRAAPPDARTAPSNLVSVRSLAPEEGDGVLSLLVTIGGPDGTGVESALVSAVWTSLTDTRSAPVSGECVTVSGGVCALAIVDTELPRPVSVTITNLEHPEYGYEPADPADISATFE